MMDNFRFAYKNLNLFDVLGQIAHIETSTRTDGTTPLLDRVCDAIFNLDRQPNKTSSETHIYGKRKGMR